MKLLLTSAGITNASIHDAMVGMLAKPIGESDALCIPTATYGHPMTDPSGAWRFIAGREPRTPMCELGWQSLGVLLPPLGLLAFLGLLHAFKMLMTRRIPPMTF